MIKLPWQSKKKLLGFWDFKSSNIALGSFIEFQIGLVCAANKYGLKKIDLALAYDADQPVGHPKYSSWISPENFYYHLFELLPLAYLIPQFGSFFIFNSRKQFEDFYLENKDDYETYPDYSDYVSGVSSLMRNMEFVKNFYNDNNFIPRLQPIAISEKWAKSFIKEYCKNKYAVAVTIRLNDHQSPVRNSDPDAWRNFFEYCKTAYPDVLFLVLGRKGDRVEKEFGGFSNIIFPKHFNATVEQDAALVESCCFFMATMSGLASYTVFSAHVPYIISKYLPPYKHDLPYGAGLPWQNKEFQHLLWGEEDGNLLIDKFESLFSRINKKKWAEKIGNADQSFLVWPYKK